MSKEQTTEGYNPKRFNDGYKPSVGEKVTNGYQPSKNVISTPPTPPPTPPKKG